MKKKNLTVGFVFILIGIGLILLAHVADSRLQGILSVFAGGMLGPGIAMVLRYFYWKRPVKQEEYAVRLEREQIYQRDERNIMLRDRAGRYTFVLNLLLISVSMLVFAIMGNLGIVQGSKTIVRYLFCLLAVNVTASVMIFNRLLKK